MSIRISVLMTGITLLCFPTHSRAEAPKRLEAKLLEAVKALDDAFVTRDARTIRKLAASNHISVASRYQFFNLEDQLKDLPNLKLTSNKSGPKKVIWLRDDVAVVTYEAQLAGTYDGHRIDSTVRIVATWFLQDGRWVEQTYQETVIKKKAARR